MAGSQSCTQWMLQPSVAWPTPRPPWMLWPCPAWSALTFTSGSLAGSPRVPPGPFLPPVLVGALAQLGVTHPIVSAFSGGCCSLAQLDAAHILSWLFHAPVGFSLALASLFAALGLVECQVGFCQ